MADSAVFIDFDEAAAPATPAAGKIRQYAKTDGKLYQKDDAGAETDLAAAVGGGGGGLVIQDSYERSASNYTTTSTSFVDMDATNLTWDVVCAVNDRLYLNFQGGGHSSGSVGAWLNVSVDGTDQGDGLTTGTGLLVVALASFANLSFTWISAPMAADTYTVRPRFRVTSGTFTISGGSASYPRSRWAVGKIVA